MKIKARYEIVGGLKFVYHDNLITVFTHDGRSLIYRVGDTVSLGQVIDQATYDALERGCKLEGEFEL